MSWAPSSASDHCGLANTRARQKLWAVLANQVLKATGGDEVRAIEIANRALHHRMTRDLTRRVLRANATVQLRLF